MAIAHRVRRVRREESKPFAKSEAVKVLQSIAERQEEIARLTALMETDVKWLQDRMVENKLINFESPDGDIQGDIIRPSGRSSTTVDVRALHKHLEDDDFYQCVAAQITKVREFLPEKTLKTISKTVAGKPGEPKLVVWRRSAGKKPRSV